VAEQRDQNKNRPKIENRAICISRRFRLWGFRIRRNPDQKFLGPLFSLTWTAGFLQEKRIFVDFAKRTPPTKFDADSKSRIRFEIPKILAGYMRSTRADFIYPVEISKNFIWKKCSFRRCEPKCALSFSSKNATQRRNLQKSRKLMQIFSKCLVEKIFFWIFGRIRIPIPFLAHSKDMQKIFRRNFDFSSSYGGLFEQKWSKKWSKKMVGKIFLDFCGFFDANRFLGLKEGYAKNFSMKIAFLGELWGIIRTKLA